MIFMQSYQALILRQLLTELQYYQETCKQDSLLEINIISGILLMSQTEEDTQAEQTNEFSEQDHSQRKSINRGMKIEEEQNESAAVVATPKKLKKQKINLNDKSTEKKPSNEEDDVAKLRHRDDKKPRERSPEVQREQHKKQLQNKAVYTAPVVGSVTAPLVVPEQPQQEPQINIPVQQQPQVHPLPQSSRPSPKAGQMLLLQKVISSLILMTLCMYITKPTKIVKFTGLYQPLHYSSAPKLVLATHTSQFSFIHQDSQPMTWILPIQSTKTGRVKGQVRYQMGYEYVRHQVVQLQSGYEEHYRMSQFKMLGAEITHLEINNREDGLVNSWTLDDHNKIKKNITDKFMEDWKLQVLEAERVKSQPWLNSKLRQIDEYIQNAIAPFVEPNTTASSNSNTDA